MYIIKALNNWFNNFMFYLNKVYILIGLCDLQNFNAMLSEADVNTNVFFFYFMKKVSFLIQHSFSLRGRGDIYIKQVHSYISTGNL